METKKIKNKCIIDLMNILVDGRANSLTRRTMPYKIIYAIHRTAPEIEAAYKAYDGTLDNLCTQYGTTRKKLILDDKEKTLELKTLIDELLNTEVDVEVYTFDKSILDNYNEEQYSPLSYVEFETLCLFASESEDKKESKKESEEK